VKCLDDAEIARIEALGLSDAHADSCIDCQRRIARDRALAQRVRSISAQPLSLARRRTLGAEILASAQFLPPARSRRVPIAIAASGLAMAAGLAWWLATEQPQAALPAMSDTPSEAIAMSGSSASADDPAPRAAPPQIKASEGAVLSHDVGELQDTISLSDGTLALDTRASRFVDVQVGTTRVRVADASVIVTARAHRVISVQVVVGSARIDSADQRVTLQRDSLWMPTPTGAQRSMAIYREAWLALRAGRNREAMELIDRVTESVALEDAMYWGAIAAKRSGDLTLARERIEQFLARFPQSDYAEQLTADLAP
jgi:TolA-binding protein